jgi:hypothetical protein
MTRIRDTGQAKAKNSSAKAQSHPKFTSAAPRSRQQAPQKLNVLKSAAVNSEAFDYGTDPVEPENGV